MKKLAILLLAVTLFATAAADGRRVFRSQFVVHQTREDALADNCSNNPYYIKVAPSAVSQRRDAVIYMQSFDTDTAWGDRTTWLHLQNTGSAYTLIVNGKVAAEVEDALSPADFDITDALVQGHNTITVELRQSRLPKMQSGAPAPAAPAFEGSYIFSQRKAHIHDYTAAIVPDTAEKRGLLNLDIIVANDFAYAVDMTVGYDIVSPEGKLIDYTIREISLEPRQRDTLHIKTPVYGVEKHAWNTSAGDNAPLYTVTLYTKRNDKPEEYISFKTAYGVTSFEDGKLTRNGYKIGIIPHYYRGVADRAALRRHIREMKTGGVNTFITEYPQPLWFYDECDRAGIFVIDRAAIYAADTRNVRARGGTPANDPQMAGEFIERVDAMYYRVRNHPSLAGFMLAGEAGNGYSMYKAYQHLKNIEQLRPVVYYDARGEWNSDL